MERRTLLDKLNWFLIIGGLQSYENDNSIFADLHLLVKLRNAIIHWKAEWSSDPKVSQKYEDLVGSKFPHNKLSGGATQFFIPYRCFGFGSGAWAVTTVLNFMLDYAGRLAIEPTIKRWEAEIRSSVSMP